MSSPEGRENSIERALLKRGKSLQTRMESEDTAYVEENQEISDQVVPYRYIFPYDKRIKVNSEGSLWILSYPPILRPVQDMFPDLPVTRKSKVAQRRWSNPDDIENAIRMADHIAEAYEPQDGEVAQNTLGVVGRIKEMSHEYQRLGITEQQREQVAIRTADVLVATRFANARKPEKQKIKNMLINAGQRDSLQRINTPRSRFILSNAWIDLSKELIVNRIVGEKYRTMGWRLRQERDFERFCLEQSEARIDLLIGLREGSPEYKNLLSELEMFIYQYNSSDYIKAKPYSKTAAISRFFIFGDGQKPPVDRHGNIIEGKLNEDLEILAKYIGMENATMYWGTPHFKSLKPDQQVKRLHAISVAINQTLEEGDLNLERDTA